MKKILLIASFIVGATTITKGQHLVLVEEFSGENCSTCAAENPAFNALMRENPTKAVLLRYMVPIPSAGPIYLQNTGLNWVRMNYYKCYFAPWVEVDGKVVGSGQYPALASNVTQGNINSAHDVTPPIKIVISPYYNKAQDSITVVVNVTANQLINKVGAKMRLRVAFVESLKFATAPGLNGETEFENVVRRTYPDINGTYLTNYWTSGQSQSIVIKGLIPTYINKSNPIFMAAWVQNDSTKEVLETVTSPIIKSVGIGAGVGVGVFNDAGIYPNPANSTARVVLNNDRPQVIRLRLADGLGRQVHASQEQFYSSGTVQMDIPTAELATGLYYVTVYSAEGTKSLPLQVVHQ